MFGLGERVRLQGYLYGVLHLHGKNGNGRRYLYTDLDVDEVLYSTKLVDNDIGKNAK